MVVTFPHLGNVYIAGKAFLEELGQEVVPPPPCSKRTLELGTKYSPETMCLPFKINIGNYIESIEKGADTILITGSCGPCRFGYYSILEKNILADLGYNADFIVFDPLREGFDQLKEGLCKALNINSFGGLMRASKFGWQLIHRTDYLTQLANEKRAYAVDSYQVDSIMNEYLSEIQNTYGARSMLELINSTEERLLQLEICKDKNPIKIGIIGEMYTIIEPFVNLEVEKKLGHMGVYVEKSLTPTRWIKHHVSKFPFGCKEENEKYKLAKPYLPTLVGGHGRETVGSAIQYSKEGFDGVIQILPLNCMPEIVAKSILPTIQKDYNIPIMTLVVDEMTGESGYLTRLEAFVDLLLKNREEGKNGRLLHGC